MKEKMLRNEDYNSSKLVILEKNLMIFSNINTILLKIIFKNGTVSIREESTGLFRGFN